MPVTELSQFIEARTLGDETARLMREHIIYGNYGPGSRLSEAEVASVLGVSRTCVREAFAILESEGLVRRVRNRYTQIVRFTPRDAREVMQLRSAIEGLCARIVVAEDRVPLEELERCLTGIEQAILSTPIDRRGYVEHDLGFHRALINASGNTHALRHWSLLEAQIHAMLFLVLEDLDVTVESTIGLHSALLETLRCGSPEDAEQALSRHGLSVIHCLEMRLEKESVF